MGEKKNPTTSRKGTIPSKLKKKKTKLEVQVYIGWGGAKAVH